MIGALKRWNDMSYGFLRGEDNADYFVSAAEMARSGIASPELGDEFEFDVLPPRDGTRAAKAVRLRRVV